MSRQHARFYRRLCESREKGDYTDLVEFDHVEVETWLAEASRFVDDIGRLAVEVLSQPA